MSVIAFLPARGGSKGVPIKNVKILAGKRGMTLTAADLEHYQGERGRRGNKLPRGLQRVDGIEVVKAGITSAQKDEINPTVDNGSSLPRQ